MKITQLIQKLQVAHKRYGNLDVHAGITYEDEWPAIIKVRKSGKAEMNILNDNTQFLILQLEN